MTDKQGDPDRRPAEDSGTTTPGNDDGFQTGLLSSAGAGPDWTQAHGTNAEPPVDAEPEMSPAVLK
ncbi:MAG: hypothetical protein H0U52_02845 [Chloroflexi bacterium]|nr:hypothetical protein [Chloroflexota bacterium]